MTVEAIMIAEAPTSAEDMMPAPSIGFDNGESAIALERKLSRRPTTKKITARSKT